MHFIEIVKEELFPQLTARGFVVAQESKGRISFASGDFEILCVYDYAGKLASAATRPAGSNVSAGRR